MMQMMVVCLLLNIFAYFQTVSSPPRDMYF